MHDLIARYNVEGHGTPGELGTLHAKYAGGGVVKPVRQWLKGEVERAIGKLRSTIGGRDPREVSEQIEREFANQPDAMTDFEKDSLRQAQLRVSYNKWLESNLVNYIKREAGTEGDSVARLLGELRSAKAREVGGLHHGSDDDPWPYSDFSSIINSRTVDLLRNFAQKDYGGFDPMDGWWRRQLADNPWVEKLKGDDRVHYVMDELLEPAGVTHLVDELWNQVRHDSDLPENFRLRPESLTRLSVADAVKRAIDVGNWRKAEAERKKLEAIRDNPAVYEFKKYPEGFRWVELKKPHVQNDTEVERVITDHQELMNEYPDLDDELRNAAMDDVMLDELAAEVDDETDEYMYEAMRRVDEHINNRLSQGIKVTESQAMEYLRQALKAEGDFMGHCVGGYCSTVADGSSRIFSLRDPEGRPHVTIETKPGQWFYEADKFEDPTGKYRNFHELINKTRKGDGDYEPVARQLAERYGLSLPSRIAQIKGKGNKAPVDKYLPFVQDFVRGGKWTTVDDLRNTGLYRRDELMGGHGIDKRGLDEFDRRFGRDASYSHLLRSVNQASDLPDYVTLDEWLKHLKPEGFAQGGLVTAEPSLTNLAAKYTQGFAGGGVVKPVRQWLKGAVERALKPLLKKHGLRDPDDVIQELEAVLLSPYLNPVELYRDRLNALRASSALNKWVRSNLANYVKRDLGTEWDPVAQLARDERVLHYDPDANVTSLDDPELHYLDWQFAVENFGPRRREVGDLLADDPAWLDENPWLSKLSEHDVVYDADKMGVFMRSLQFPHLIDELHNVIRPDSNLPAQFRLDPHALTRLSVPDAVRRVAGINKWRKEQAEKKARQALNNQAVHEFKAYPEGFKWVELKKPERDPSWSDDEDTEMYKALKDALKSEGDTMGHCVGGYCDNVASGSSRIFSLRDAEGRPHVTIETRPLDGWKDFRSLKGDPLLRRLSEMDVEEIDKLLRHRGLPMSAQGYKDSKYLYHPNLPYLLDPSYLEDPLDRIIQIKGKGNAKPADKYLPFVQDFVRSSPWSDVGDLRNTGLYDKRALLNGLMPPESAHPSFTGGNFTDYSKALFELGKSGRAQGELPDYVTMDEWLKHLGYDTKAAGGLVEPQNELQELVARYNEPQRFAGGGVVKPVRQWLKGAVEKALEPLLKKFEGFDPEFAPGVPQNDEMIRLSALNKWVRSNLANYVKRDMGTEWDPVAQLARDERVLHMEPNFQVLQDAIGEDPDFNPFEYEWTSRVDAYGPNAVNAAARRLNRAELEENPWLEKLHDDEKVYGFNDTGGEFIDALNFPHLIDELNNVIRPDSDLPPQFRLDAHSLPRLSVPDAVRRVAGINAWRKEQAEKKALQGAIDNPATFTFKEYPEGFRWVELKKPEDVGKKVRSLVDVSQLDEEAQLEFYHNLPQRIIRDVRRELRQLGADDGLTGRELNEYVNEAFDDYLADYLNNAKLEAPSVVDQSMAHLRQALKNEGDLMGHCVGGYCDNVAAGKSRIFSLRDKEGRPHVTIETAPESWFTAARKLPDPMGEYDNFHDRVTSYAQMNNSSDFYGTAQKLAAQYNLQPPNQNILQIKGKQNAKPIDKYLPFVQDFVRSGKWGDVHDIQNTGLRPLKDVFNATELKRIMSQYRDPLPNFLTQSEIDELNKLFPSARPRPQRKAEGGLVYDPNRVNNMYNELRALING